ncbi:Pr6Pr family membrane protein [Agromyces atrinae]|uniref:Pr6Pr family membrane protein n=1 Tax=Agromyces atrinae TaxID=592376 RepID=UPI001F5AC76E|nr:Pr6Pr family membrane protein [Agromyces atrinae]MCI2957466.1 Pr6Pr family membrane protein [Agromyces atrinae]
MKPLVIVLRIAAAAAIVIAIVGQFVQSWSMVPDRLAFVVNFFSFFTILSNALSAIVLVIGVVYAVAGRVDPPTYNLVRACIVTYMATTFVVYNLLLRDISLDQATTVSWSNEILHVWAPLYLVVDWLIAPGRTPIAWQRFWLIAVFPLAWAVYSMIRGPIVGWYPYPFLNPANGGYGAVAVYVIAIAAFILLVGAGVVALSRTRLPAARRG